MCKEKKISIFKKGLQTPEDGNFSLPNYNVKVLNCPLPFLKISCKKFQKKNQKDLSKFSVVKLIL